jgi:hypothetical protein
MGCLVWTVDSCPAVWCRGGLIDRRAAFFFISAGLIGSVIFSKNTTYYCNLQCASSRRRTMQSAVLINYVRNMLLLSG